MKRTSISLLIVHNGIPTIISLNLAPDILLALIAGAAWGLALMAASGILHLPNFQNEGGNPPSETIAPRPLSLSAPTPSTARMGL